MTRARLVLVVAVLLALLVPPGDARACTSFVVTRGATSDGSTLMTYIADSHTLYGELYFTPAGIHPAGEMLEIFDWDSGRHVGRIRQAPRTFQVIGNMNEHQVSIGETTFGGRADLVDPEGGIDYGSLMFVTLQRARTAREAVETMGALAEEYGFASEGESFSVADPKEAWIVEMVGKGPKGKGALWVARRVPDGYVTAHANAARIRKFPLGDAKNCLYSRDVIAFARDRKWFGGKDGDFSFAEAYNPASFGAQRFCELRVWAMFRRVSAALRDPTDYVRGVQGAEPLPLWIKPDHPLAARDVMDLMRDHFEGTEFDLSKGVGAGPYALPYRWRPLTWTKDGAPVKPKPAEAKGPEEPQYLNERSASTQQTGFSFVAQARSSLPDPIGGVLWFGVDDTYCTVFVPMYCGIREAPFNYAVGTGTFTRFSWDSAWWVFNAVANWAYSRWSDIAPEIRTAQQQLEGEFEAQAPDVEAAAAKLFQDTPELARYYLTRWSAKQSDKTVARWRKLWEQLFVKYLDGNTRDELGKVNHPGYPKAWYERLIREEGDRLKVTKFPGEPEDE